MGKHNKHWCTECCILYPLCNDRLEELTRVVLFEHSYFFFFHILIVLTQLEPFANKYVTFTISVTVKSCTVLKMLSLCGLLYQSNNNKKTVIEKYHYRIIVFEIHHYNHCSSKSICISQVLFLQV